MKVDPKITQISFETPSQPHETFRLEQFETLPIASTSYQASSMTSGNPLPYFVRLDVGGEFSAVGTKSATFQYLVVWDSIGGLEIQDENLVNQPGGFNP